MIAFVASVCMALNGNDCGPVDVVYLAYRLPAETSPIFLPHHTFGAIGVISIPHFIFWFPNDRQCLMTLE